MARRLEDRKVETAIRDEFLVIRKREKIIQAASKVFAEKGFHQATIRDISECSGLGPGTIYNYVKKKEDILYLIYSKLTTKITETLIMEAMKNNNDPLEQLKEALKKVIEIVWDNQDLILLMYQETGALDKESLYTVLSRESNAVAVMEKILGRGKEKGVIRSKNIRMGADIIIFLLAFIPLRRWNLNRRFNEKQIKSGLIDFILEALCINPSKK